MPNRRSFLKGVAGASAGLFSGGRGLADAALRSGQIGAPIGTRREVDTMVFHEDGLRHLVAEVGIGQIFYGTDYPFDWPVGVDFILNAPFLRDADKEAILGGNLIKLLRIAA